MFDERGQGELLDLIYGAAAEPGLWVTVMERMTDTVGGNSAWLSKLDMIDGSGSGVLARIDPTRPGEYLAHWSLRNPLSNVADPAAYLRDWTPRILTDDDLMAKEDLVRTEIYNDFMLPQEIHSVLMIRLARQGSDVCVLNLHRPRRMDPFGRAEIDIAAAVHPHLIRAFKLSRVFSGPRTLGEAAVAALDHSTKGLFILDGAGRLLHANRAGERILARRRGLGLLAGRLTGPNASASRALEAVILAAASRDPAIRAGGSMALPSADGRAPLSVTVAPLRAERWPMLGGGPSVLASVTDLGADLNVSEARMRDLFALTAAEARVTSGLLRGERPRQVAEASGVSVTTVRSQLASIFGKTGAADQAELSRLLMRVGGDEGERVGECSTGVIVDRLDRVDGRHF
ncbi:MAG: hypothetical protein M3T55_04755 [Pseudomonadota bacterium]|nr:hypothetical protein [Pseudomonadota bacterium]